MLKTYSLSANSVVARVCVISYLRELFIIITNIVIYLLFAKQSIASPNLSKGEEFGLWYYNKKSPIATASVLTCGFGYILPQAKTLAVAGSLLTLLQKKSPSSFKNLGNL